MFRFTDESGNDYWAFDPVKPESANPQPLPDGWEDLGSIQADAIDFGRLFDLQDGINRAVANQQHSWSFQIATTNRETLELATGAKIDWRDPALPTVESTADWIEEHLGIDPLPAQRYWLSADVIDDAPAPRKRRGLTGKAYRIARRGYARQRRLGTWPKIYRTYHVPAAST